MPLGDRQAERDVSLSFRTRNLHTSNPSSANHRQRLCLIRALCRCYTECDTCKAYCSNGAARAIKDAYICTFGQPTLGIAAAVQISDAGQHIVSRHGAQRTKGRAPIPEDAWLETFDLLVNNNVDSPRVPRNSVSCRKEHRESTNGKFVPHLDQEGNPVLRSGFMVRTRPAQLNLHSNSVCS